MRSACAVVLCALAVALASAGAPNPVPFLTAEEGLPQLGPEKPAGALVMDRTKRLPAVGGMPVEFRRSPDRT